MIDDLAPIIALSRNRERHVNGSKPATTQPLEEGTVTQEELPTLLVRFLDEMKTDIRQVNLKLDNLPATFVSRTEYEVAKSEFSVRLKTVEDSLSSRVKTLEDLRTTQDNQRQSWHASTIGWWLAGAMFFGSTAISVILHFLH